MIKVGYNKYQYTIVQKLRIYKKWWFNIETSKILKNKTGKIIFFNNLITNLNLKEIFKNNCKTLISFVKIIMTAYCNIPLQKCYIF